MKYMGTFLWILAFIMFVAGIASAIAADEYYNDYSRYSSKSYGYSGNTIDKIYGDANKTVAIVEFASSVLLAFSAHAIHDTAAKLEDLKNDVETIKASQKQEFDDLQDYLKKCSDRVVDLISLAISQHTNMSDPRKTYIA